MKKQNRNFKTLRGFFNTWGKYMKCQNRVTPFSFSDYLRGYIPAYIGGNYVQIHFHLSEEAKAELFDLMAGAITSSKASRKLFAAIMAKYRGEDYGIFTRLWIRQEYNGTRLVGDYCAGQDWISEVYTIKSLLRKGSVYC